MTKPRILLAIPVPDHVRVMLDDACEVVTAPGGGRPTREQLAAILPAVDGVLTSNQVAIDNDLLDGCCHRLRVVANNGVGYDNVDIPYATSKGVLVCNTPGVLSGAVADLTFAMLLNLARHIPANERHVREGGWRTAPGRVGVDVRGKTLGIIGLGRIGHVVAETAKGFRMKVIYYDPIRDPEAEASGLAAYRERDEVFHEADFVTVHVFLDETTHHHIGRREFELMKPTAYLINTSRGPVIDQQALCAALHEGRIASAALDVMEREPLDPADALCSAPNLTLLPHIGSAAAETRLAMIELAARNVINAVTGGTPEAMVNPAALAARTAAV